MTTDDFVPLRRREPAATRAGEDRVEDLLSAALRQVPVEWWAMGC
jgi:hypothetical protein